MKLVVGLALAGAVLCGCAKHEEAQVGTEGWTYADKVDPITKDRTATAIRQLVSDQDPNLVVDAEWSCATKSAAPSELQLKLTAYDQSKKVGDQINGADVDADTVEFRLDGYGSGTIPKAGTEKFSNEVPLNVLSMVAVSDRFQKDTSASEQLTVVGINPESAIDPTIAQPIQEKFRKVTDNYRWVGNDVTVRFKAATSAGAHEHVFTLPLQNPSVVKVAQACGWRTSATSAPQPMPTDPVKADVATEPSRARPAKCSIFVTPTQGGAYDGACLFEPVGKDGSFLITRDDQGGQLTENVSAMTVQVIRPNVASLTVNNSSGAGHDTWDVELERKGGCWNQSGDVEDGVSICVK
jgi:hypothetical protein